MKFLGVLLGLLCCTACNRADNYLPDPSQEGENTAGWMVLNFAYKQGKPFSMGDSENATKAEIKQNNEHQLSGHIYVRATSSFDTSPEYRKERIALADDRLYIYLENIPATKGVYSCKDGVTFRYEKMVDRKLPFALTYMADSVQNGKLEITAIDWEKKIISGVFSFDATLEEDVPTQSFISANTAMLASIGVQDSDFKKMSVQKGRFDMSF